MLERNRCHGESNKTLPPPGLWVQWADTSPQKYFTSLSICHSYTVTPRTVTRALPGRGPSAALGSSGLLGQGHTPPPRVPSSLTKVGPRAAK